VPKTSPSDRRNSECLWHCRARCIRPVPPQTWIAQATITPGSLADRPPMDPHLRRDSQRPLPYDCFPLPWSTPLLWRARGPCPLRPFFTKTASSIKFPLLYPQAHTIRAAHSTFGSRLHQSFTGLSRSGKPSPSLEFSWAYTLPTPNRVLAIKRPMRGRSFRARAFVNPSLSWFLLSIVLVSRKQTLYFSLRIISPVSRS